MGSLPGNKLKKMIQKFLNQSLKFQKFDIFYSLSTFGEMFEGLKEKRKKVRK